VILCNEPIHQPFDERYLALSVRRINRMDLPPEYVLHLLPLMAICGIPPPQAQNLPPRTPERSSSSELLASPRPAPSLAAIPYIDSQLGRAILKLIDQWRTLALWEPTASKDRQIPGATLEAMFRMLPVDRVSFSRIGTYE
jgi:hypothetical protein